MTRSSALRPASRTLLAALVALVSLGLPTAAMADTPLVFRVDDYAVDDEPSDGAYCWRGFALRPATDVEVARIVVGLGSAIEWSGDPDPSLDAIDWTWGAAIWATEVSDPDLVLDIVGPPVASGIIGERTGPQETRQIVDIVLGTPVTLLADTWYVLASGYLGDPDDAAGGDVAANHLDLLNLDERALLAGESWLSDFAPRRTADDDAGDGPIGRAVSLGWCPDDDELVDGFPNVSGVRRDLGPDEDTSNRTSTVPLLGLIGSVGGGAQPAAAPPIGLTCDPLAVAVGATITCTVSGGPPDFDIQWRAAHNPVFSEGVVRTGADGTGTFGFVVPAAALGASVTVELVAWTAPQAIGVAGGPVPASVPAGEGGLPSRAVLLGLLGAAGAVLVGRRLVTAG